MLTPVPHRDEAARVGEEFVMAYKVLQHARKGHFLKGKAMREIVEYCVASKHSLKEMEDETNRLISGGWQPFGGLQVVVPVINDDAAPLYSQALVRYK